MSSHLLLRDFVPCTHRQPCSCLTEEEKQNGVLYNYHIDDMCLKYIYKSEHDEFKESGWFKIQKPAWKYDCSGPMEDKTIDMIEKFCHIFNLKCTCGAVTRCSHCNSILSCFDGCCEPTLEIDSDLQLDFSVLGKILPYLDIDKLEKEMNSVSSEI